MEKHPAISIRNLNVWYGGLHALKQASFDITPNTITALIGASGSGKSTFLRAINRMLDTVPLARATGEIEFQNKNVLNKHTDVNTLRTKIGMVFQSPTPFPKSIFDNIAYGLTVQGTARPPRRFRRVLDPAVLEKSVQPLEAAVVRSLKEAALWDEVRDRLHQSAYRLSGGQQQRLCIARAVAVRPQVLLLDEPCSELDPISTRKIEDLLVALKRDYTIVIVTHNMHQARRISDTTVFFHLGEIIETGATADVFSKPHHELTANYVRGDFG